MVSIRALLKDLRITGNVATILPMVSFPIRKGTAAFKNPSDTKKAPEHPIPPGELLDRNSPSTAT